MNSHTTNVRNFSLLFIFCFIFIFNAFAQEESVPEVVAPEALRAFSPEEWESNQLKASPDESSANLRLIQPSDQLKVLRSENLWYEVDLVTSSGLEFRGWLKGSLPTELKPREREISITQPEVEEGPSPLESKGYRWFWDSDWSERGYFGFGVGAQSIEFSLSGTNPSDDVVEIPGYNFFGFGLGLSTKFSLMETQVKKIPLLFSFEADYLFGFFQVRFANNFDPVEVAGDAYRIQTHNITADIWTQSSFQLGKAFVLKPGLGLGYLYFEAAPDLKRTANGNVVFTQTGLQGPTTTIRTEISWKETIKLTPWWKFILLPSVFESPNSFSGAEADSKSITLSGFPILLGANFEYLFSKDLALQFQTSYLNFGATHEGPSRRIDVEYTNVDIQFTQLSALLGLKFGF